MTGRLLLKWAAGSAIAILAWWLTVDVFFPRALPFWAFFSTWLLAAVWSVVDEEMRPWSRGRSRRDERARLYRSAGIVSDGKSCRAEGCLNCVPHEHTTSGILFPWRPS